jgi:hypothetical protein
MGFGAAAGILGVAFVAHIASKIFNSFQMCAHYWDGLVEVQLQVAVVYLISCLLEGVKRLAMILRFLVKEGTRKVRAAKVLKLVLGRLIRLIRPERSFSCFARVFTAESLAE